MLPLRITLTGKLRGEPFAVTRVAMCTWPPPRPKSGPNDNGYGHRVQNITSFTAQLSPTDNLVVTVPSACNVYERTGVGEMKHDYPPGWKARWQDDPCYPTVIESHALDILPAGSVPEFHRLSDLDLHFEPGQPTDEYSADLINTWHGAESDERRVFVSTRVRTLEGSEWRQCPRQVELIKRAASDPELSLQRGGVLRIDTSSAAREKLGIMASPLLTACEPRTRGMSDRNREQPLVTDRDSRDRIGSAFVSADSTVQMDEITLGRRLSYYTGTYHKHCLFPSCSFANKSDHAHYWNTMKLDDNSLYSTRKHLKFKIRDQIFFYEDLEVPFHYVKNKRVLGTPVFLDTITDRLYLIEFEQNGYGAMPRASCIRRRHG